MVKTATQRTNSYGAKIDADAVRIRIVAQKPNMVSNQAPHAAAMAELQGHVRDLLNGTSSANAISPMFSAPYQALANKLYGLNLKFAGSAFTNEAKLVCALWVNRGANQAAVTAIAALFSVTVP